MIEKYKPPFNMNDNITNLVFEIGELIGKVSSFSSLSQNPKLRRESRIKSIHSSLAIENNSLTIEQATAIIDGKRVLGPPQDIKEVENAYEAYEKLSILNPYSLDDLLLAHKFMMSGLIKDAGMFRSKNVGVYDGDKLIHVGTPADYVPEVMHDLFDWLKTSSLHPLIKSCIFHYEFEFIHPFNDGNGRTGRLWQSLILQKWKPFFQWLPVETMIFNNQSEYYNALATSDKVSDATDFVEFMLRMIKNTLIEIVDGQSDVSANVSANVSVNSSELKVLKILSNNKYSTTKEISDILNLSSRQISRIISSLKSKGLLERVGSDKNGYWNTKKL